MGASCIKGTAKSRGPAGDFNRDEIRAYFAALREIEEWVQTDTYNFLRQLGAVSNA